MMKTKRYKTPAGYVAPLRSRAAIVAYLKTAADDRPGYGLFAFNVKAHSVDLSFDHLLALGRESLDEVPRNPSDRWVEECRAKYEEVKDNLWEWAIDNCRSAVTGDDSNRLLWNEDHTVAEWEFNGRSGGWLVLKSFEGLEMGELAVRWEGSLALWDVVETLPYRTLRRLYRFIVQCSHDFRREAVRSEIEYQAAFDLFVNVCGDVESDEALAARTAAEAASEAKEHAERAEWEARDTVTV